LAAKKFWEESCMCICHSSSVE